MKELIECPYCGGLSHSIGPTTAHAMVVDRYTDDEGSEHFHDPNTYDQTRHCRGCGGKFNVRTRRACPACNFGDVPPEVTKLGV